MHVVYDENGNPVSHGSQSHDGDSPCGGHEHCGACSHEGGEVCHDETLTALVSMIRYNMQHSPEMDKAVFRLEDDDLFDVARQIRHGISEIQKGTMYLNLALSLYRQHLAEKNQMD